MEINPDNYPGPDKIAPASKKEKKDFEYFVRMVLTAAEGYVKNSLHLLPATELGKYLVTVRITDPQFLLWLLRESETVDADIAVPRHWRMSRSLALAFDHATNADAVAKEVQEAGLEHLFEEQATTRPHLRAFLPTYLENSEDSAVLSPFLNEFLDAYDESYSK